jgi:hypothetical protein
MAKKAKPKTKSSEPERVHREPITETAKHLAQFMRDNPNGIEKALAQRGENLIGVFSDPNFSTRGFADLKVQKIEILLQAIDDVAGGVIMLRTSMLGLQFFANKVVSFVSPHGTYPPGQVVFSVNWKDIAAFKNWRNGEGDDVTQESLNYAIYFLTVAISRLL